MNKQEAYDIAKKGALFLTKDIKGTGMFVYGYRSDGSEMHKYNILRHCGCIWALLDVYREVIKEDPIAASSIKLAIDKSTRYLIKKHIWRDNHRKIVSEEGYIKLGGVALAMLALMRYHEIFNKRNYLRIAEELSLYIRAQVEGDGALVNHKVNMLNSEPVDFVSEYYPGECVLALCELHRHTKNTFPLDYAINVTKYLHRWRDDIDLIQDHWLLQALEYLVILSKEDEKTWIYSYTKRIAEDIMVNNEKYLGGIIRSAPLACRSEGLLSWYNICPDNDKFNVLKYIEELLEHQKQFQVIEEDSKAGAFIKSHEETAIRCDYTQHNISSFIRYHRIKEE